MVSRGKSILQIISWKTAGWQMFFLFLALRFPIFLTPLLFSARCPFLLCCLCLPLSCLLVSPFLLEPYNLLLRSQALATLSRAFCLPGTRTLMPILLPSPANQLPSQPTTSSSQTPTAWTAGLFSPPPFSPFLPRPNLMLHHLSAARLPSCSPRGCLPPCLSPHPRRFSASTGSSPLSWSPASTSSASSR